MSEVPKSTKVNVAGVLLTAAVALGFIWVALQWLNRNNWPPKFSTEDIRRAEVKAFKNLQLIAQAQEKYKEVDRDGDGKQTYAGFFVHLWTSISSENEPVHIELIPRKLGFAMGAARAVDGYYFRDLHGRALPETEETTKLDYEKEWAVLGAPAVYRRTGLLTFLADSSGRILAKNQPEVPLHYPHDPLSDGWTRIESVEDLKVLQGAYQSPD